MRKPVRGWIETWEPTAGWDAVADPDGDGWAWRDVIGSHTMPAVILSLAPEDVEARRQAAYRCVRLITGAPVDSADESLILAIEAAWGMSPEADDG